MVIRPVYAPTTFLTKYGTVDTDRHHSETCTIQRIKARVWDAAIEYALLHKDLQQPVLTHPQPKGD